MYVNNQILLMQNDNANIVHILITPIAVPDFTCFVYMTPTAITKPV